MKNVIIKGVKVYPGQIWKLHNPFNNEKTARVFIISDVVSNDEIYFHGMLAPFTISDFLWLEPIKNLDKESVEIQEKANIEIHRYGIDMYEVGKLRLGIIIGFIVMVAIITWMLL